MTWLAPKLRNRVQIRKAVQTENSTTGGFTRTYSTLGTVWAEIKSLTWQVSIVSPIRGVNINENSTHKFKIRRCALDFFGGAFSSAFSAAFDSFQDLSILKSDHFLFLEDSTTVKGRLFKIDSVSNADERKEYLNIVTTEIEELGTGYAI